MRNSCKLPSWFGIVEGQGQHKDGERYGGILEEDSEQLELCIPGES